ncbi:MAG TPA: MFS transporter [Acidimicrobiales bacterium]|jgi:putative MFS transporter|nr:MFS transporter [Acidimicrobiales bacterium]
MRDSKVVSTRALIFTLAYVTVAVGYGQFGSTAALGNVAKAFGIDTNQSSLSARAGLALTTLAVGIAILRAASLFALPLCALADRVGRHRVLFVCGVAGLCITAGAALSPGYWWFVALFAIARPLLSATNIVTSVVTAELTSPRTRATALSIVTAGAALGAGVSVIVHGFFRGPNGFRILFASALIPALAVALLVRRLPETHGATHDGAHAPRLGAIPRELRGRLAIVMGVTAAIGAISGPAGGFAFVYMEDYLKLHASTVTLVVTLSAIPGVLGLLIGRWLADNKGRRITVAVGVLLTAATSLYAYSGGRAPFIIGYILGVFAGGVFAPGGAAIATEPFPATVRASAGGWIVVAAVAGAIVGLAIFGPVADATGSFAWGAAAAFLPGLVALYWLRALPETKGVILT